MNTIPRQRQHQAPQDAFGEAFEDCFGLVCSRGRCRVLSPANGRGMRLERALINKIYARVVANCIPAVAIAWSACDAFAINATSVVVIPAPEQDNHLNLPDGKVYEVESHTIPQRHSCQSKSNANPNTFAEPMLSDPLRHTPYATRPYTLQRIRSNRQRPILPRLLHNHSPNQATHNTAYDCG
jgi:hypothetical protein